MARDGSEYGADGNGQDAADGQDPAGAETSLPYAALWDGARGKLRDELSPVAFSHWIEPLVLTDIEDGIATLIAPSRNVADWVMTQYGDRIRSLLSGLSESVSWIRVIPETGTTPTQRANQTEPAQAQNDLAEQGRATNGAGIAAPPPAIPALEDFGEEFPSLDPRFTFDSFITGSSNELACAAAKRVAESDNVPFNPLFLYGGVGLGKTHLMHAIAWRLRERSPDKKIMYISAEKFMYKFIRALKEDSRIDFKEKFRSVDVLMVDDIQFIGGKDNTQDEFFHTFNALIDQSKQVVLSADKSPSDLEGMEARLRSRLGWGLVADIHPTTYELRLGILQSKIERLESDVEIPDKVVSFLAHRICSNIRELEGALNRLVAHAELIGRPITLELAQEALADLLRANERTVTIDEIQKQVAAHFNIKIADMYSARRSRNIARPRQVAMYLSKQLTPRSLPDIGRKFGGRDHTTVMHAVKKVEELIAYDRGFAEDVELLRRTLTS